MGDVTDEAGPIWAGRVGLSHGSGRGFESRIARYISGVNGISTMCQEGPSAFASRWKYVVRGDFYELDGL